MKKKILFVSIFSVAILIFLSFNNVVGDRTNSFSSVEKSPLFSIRTNRATKLDNSLYSSDYIGKGEEIKIHFPEKDNEKELMCKYIEAISQMDDKTFKKLITTIISQVNKDEELREIGAHNVLLAIKLMRTYPDELKKQILNEGEIAQKFNTSGFICPILSIIAGIILLILGWIFEKIDGYLSANKPTECYGSCSQFTCQEGTFCQKGNCLKS